MIVCWATALVIGTLLGNAAVASSLRADEVLYVCGSAGTFDDDFCWAGGEVPGAGDVAIFANSAPFDQSTVFFGDDALTDRVIVRQGDYTFELLTSTYALGATGFPTPSIVIGDDLPPLARLTVLEGTISGDFVDIGRQANANGTLRLVGKAAALQCTSV